MIHDLSFMESKHKIHTYCWSIFTVWMLTWDWSIGHYFRKSFWHVCHLNSIICKHTAADNWKTPYLNKYIPRALFHLFCKIPLWSKQPMCCSLHSSSLGWERHSKVWWLQDTEAMPKNAVCQPKTGSQSCLQVQGKLQQLMFSPKFS